MPGSYPTYTSNTQDTKNDIPGRADIANASDYNDHDREIIIHQSLINNHDTRLNNLSRHLRFNIINPYSVYHRDAHICLVPKTSDGMVFKHIEVTCNSDPSLEVSGSISYADSFKGLENPVVITTINTSGGVLSSNITPNVTVPSGKYIYLVFSAEPEENMAQISFDLSYVL
jgi:hypothetical protein